MIDGFYEFLFIFVKFLYWGFIVPAVALHFVNGLSQLLYLLFVLIYELGVVSYMLLQLLFAILAVN